MKKYIAICATLCVAFAFTSCKSSESAYRKAYEKAKAESESERTDNDIPVVTPLVTAPATQTTVSDNYENVALRSENVTLVDGAGLSAYSVVVGSFGSKANAFGLQGRLKNQGYDAQIVKNVDRDMYRVVASTFASKASAVQSRDALRSQFPDAWLLYNK